MHIIMYELFDVRMMSVNCHKYQRCSHKQNISHSSCVERRCSVVLMALLVVGVCSPGWSCYSSWCYYASSDKVNHTTARTRCHSENADLVSISDSTENDFVKRIWSVH